MKKLLTIIALAAISCGLFAQKKNVKLPELTFTTIKENPVTSVKNQYRSGTCWAFSTLGFLESESIRIRGIKDTVDYPDFSEFFIVSHSYLDRADKFVRLDGNLRFSAGSVAGDVLHVIKDYGLVPQEAMTGMQYGTSLPVQAELDKVLKGYVETIVSNPNRELTTAWKKGFKGILDAYLGTWPEKFTVKGKEYTPETYRDAMKIVPEDYIFLTSFTHHQFYTWFPLEICDNWRWDDCYNVPIDEFMAVIDNAIMNGYTIAWSADVSSTGFDRKGIGVLLDLKNSPTEGSDQARWVGTDQTKPVVLKEIVELVPTQESRQKEFDNKTLTDDHGLQLYGIAKDQNGKKFYIAKNSWGTDNKKYKGIWYVSEAYVKAQSIQLMVHKSGLPKDLRKKIESK